MDDDDDDALLGVVEALGRVTASATAATGLGACGGAPMSMTRVSESESDSMRSLDVSEADSLFAVDTGIGAFRVGETGLEAGFL